MIVYYFTNYHPNDRQYKSKKSALDKVLDRCNELGYEFHPMTSSADVILHVAIANKLKENYIVVGSEYDVIPKIKDSYKFISTKDFLKRG